MTKKPKQKKQQQISLRSIAIIGGVIVAVIAIAVIVVLSTQSNKDVPNKPEYVFNADSFANATIGMGNSYTLIGTDPDFSQYLLPGKVYDFTSVHDDGTVYIAIYVVNDDMSEVQMIIGANPVLVMETPYEGDELSAVDLRLRQIAEDINGHNTGVEIGIYVNNELQGKYHMDAIKPIQDQSI